MRYDGRLVVSELELIEPGLYLDVLPGNAAAVRRRGRRRGCAGRPDGGTPLLALAGVEC